MLERAPFATAHVTQGNGGSGGGGDGGSLPAPPPGYTWLATQQGMMMVPLPAGGRGPMGGGGPMGGMPPQQGAYGYPGGHLGGYGMPAQPYGQGEAPSAPAWTPVPPAYGMPASGKPTAYSQAELASWSVWKLKEYLLERGVDARYCTEKSELVALAASA